MRESVPVVVLCVLAMGCPAPLDGVDQGTVAAMDAEADLSGRRGFFEFPWPSDLRVKADGSLDLDGWPIAANDRIAAFRTAAHDKVGFPVLPVGYFHFNGALQQRDAPELFAPDKASPVLLLELDESGAGRLLPTVASTPNPDSFTPENLLAVAAQPGVVLVPGRRYAFVIRRELGDGAGQKLGIALVMAKLLQKETPAGSHGAALAESFSAPLAALDTLGVARASIAAMTVFTPGDEAAALSKLADDLKQKYPATIEVQGLEANPRLDAAPFCHVLAKITLPQFQRGTPIFDSEGLFSAADATELPPKLRTEDALVSITLPKRAMPAGGYPLVIYFHGSGGSAREFVDGADVGPTASPVDVWPATVLGNRGFGMVGMSLPVSPDRVPGASDFAYLNFSNPVAIRDTFRQGIIESRMFIDALQSLHIAPSVIAGCAGPSLPAGETDFHFTLDRLSVQGQSMGGMYANLVSAVEPRIKAVVPTGAGGHWTSFVLTTPRIPTNEVFIGQLIGTSVTPLTWMHPGMHLIQMVLEPIDPLASTARLGRRPLPGHPARPVYEPVSTRDSYFPIATYSAMELGYGNPLAGDEIWPGVRDSLASVGDDTTATYPVKNNLTSADGTPFTGVAVQHSNDGGFDGHGVYRRLDSVKWQYGCFHQTFHENGVAVVPPPDPVGGTCPQ